MTAKPVAVDERLRDIVTWGEALARHIAGLVGEIVDRDLVTLVSD